MDQITSALRSWLAALPELDGIRVNLDRLPGEPGAVALLTEGETEKEPYLFSLRSQRRFQLVRECEYGSDPVQNEENLGWFSDLGREIQKKALCRQLPEGITALTVTVGGHLLAITGDGRAEYGMTITAEYVQSQL